MWAMLWYLGKAGTSWLIKMVQSKVSQRKYDRIKTHKLRLLVHSMVGFPTNWAKKNWKRLIFAVKFQWTNFETPWSQNFEGYLYIQSLKMDVALKLSDGTA